MMCTISVCVKIDSTNHPVWNRLSKYDFISWDVDSFENSAHLKKYSMRKNVA